MPTSYPNRQQPPLVPNYDPNNRGQQLTYNGLFSVGGAQANGHYIFVALISANPFADHQDRNGSFLEVWVSQHHHHDDLALGANVHYAGTVDFVAGQITEWTNQSGHYRPDAIDSDQAPASFPLDGRFGVALHHTVAFATPTGAKDRYGNDV